MFNSKTDIRNSEWIELVFEKRNKDYGAYDLRKHAAYNMNRALAIMLFILSISVGIAILINPKPASVAVHKSIAYTNRLIHLMPMVGEEKPKDVQFLVKDHHSAHSTVVIPAATVITKTPVTTAVNANGGTDIENNHTTTNTLPATIENNTPLASNAVVTDNDELDVKPRFLGGATEWSKFLEMNLRYPIEARQARVSGIVWISFIVERNGTISNIVIDRSAGHGFDEEAVRVLKQSPVWTPGEENGQAVRVKYSLPINFHMVR